MKILFTGCSSYIGKYLIKEFLKTSNTIYGLSRKNPEIKNKKFKWFKHDLSNKPFKKIKKIDIIIHIAGAALRKENKYDDYLKGNIFMAHNVGLTAKYCATKIIFYTSTREIYGDINSNILSENNNIINPIFYGQTKFIAEQILSSNCKTVSLRLPAVLGKGTHGWISGVLKGMIKGKKINFINCKFNNFIHVSDLYNIISSFIKKKLFFSDQFNVSCSNISTSKKVLLIMKKKLNSKSKLNELKKTGRTYTISNNKLSKYCKTMTVENAIKMFLIEESQ
tara:strand:- start:150 stop:989 length:840 start_codon:yes stop_codon:yes gene_type:complete